jgi:hypothetical protein
MDQPIWLTFLVAFIFMNVLLVGMAYMTWYERKVLAAMQDRVGPNRTGPKGLLQPIADGIKLLGKEDLIPAHADKVVFFFAPLLVFVVAITRVAVIPFGNTVTVFGHPVNLWVTDLNVGALFLLAFGSLGVYGIILGGYASANRYSLLGGLRSAGASHFLRDHPGSVAGGHFLAVVLAQHPHHHGTADPGSRFRAGSAHVDVAKLVHPLPATRVRDLFPGLRRRNEPRAL